MRSPEGGHAERMADESNNNFLYGPLGEGRTVQQQLIEVLHLLKKNGANDCGRIPGGQSVDHVTKLVRLLRIP